MFIWPSSHEIHETAVLTSEQIPAGGLDKCVHFWYYLNGENVGAIELQMNVQGRLHSTVTTTWKLSGNQNKNWVEGQAPFIRHGQSMKVYINIFIMAVMYLQILLIITFTTL